MWSAAVLPPLLSTPDSATITDGQQGLNNVYGTRLTSTFSIAQKKGGD
jgi:hypothetical protein